MTFPIEVEHMEGFSVVVPTHGRAHLVDRLLQSLKQARSNFQGECEVLVIDSSSSDQASIIKQACYRCQAVYCESVNNVPRKRNLGIKQARYEIVFFIDSDCEIEAETLNEHWATHKGSDSQVAAVLGLTQWRGEQIGFSRVLSFAPSFTAAFSFAAWLREAPWGTCTNLSVRREALLAIGGFDETIPLTVYGEDVDLGLRLNNSGFRIKCNPQAIVKHSRETMPSFLAALRKAVKTGRADYHLGIRHPENLLMEFPQPLAMFLPLLLVEAFRAAFGVSLWVLATPFLLPLFYVLVPASLSSLIERDSIRNLPYRFAAGLVDLSFQIGLTREALIHGQVNRLWTKFVYVKEQLLAERQRRVLQMWGIVVGLLAVIAFS